VACVVLLGVAADAEEPVISESLDLSEHQLVSKRRIVRSGEEDDKP